MRPDNVERCQNDDVRRRTTEDRRLLNAEKPNGSIEPASDRTIDRERKMSSKCLLYSSYLNSRTLIEARVERSAWINPNVAQAEGDDSNDLNESWLEKGAIRERGRRSGGRKKTKQTRKEKEEDEERSKRRKDKRS